MTAFDARGLRAYLIAQGHCVADDALMVRELAGGVSNMVFWVEGRDPNGMDVRFVVKQALPKLRVQADWFSDVDRIFRERDALSVWRPWAPDGAIPEVLFSDDEYYLFAMTAAPSDAVTWKSLLLDGQVDVAVARFVGRLLGEMHRRSREAGVPDLFHDDAVFHQLRVDAYYDFTADAHPDVGDEIRARRDRMLSRKRCLVHGDYSPKNILVHGRDVVLLDFEVAHWGDPAFDTGFCLNHLMLKAFYRPQEANGYLAVARTFWQAYNDAAVWDEDVSKETAMQLGCLLLARVDGKSPAEYLVENEVKNRIRQTAKLLLNEEPGGVDLVFELVYDNATRCL